MDISRMRCCAVVMAVWLFAPPAFGQTDLQSAVASVAGRGFRGVILVGDQERILSEYAVGNADDAAGRAHRVDEIWPWASVTKQLTAVIIMQEVERGTLSLDATIGQVLPAFNGPTRDAVTIRQLLQHTSGLPNPDNSAVEPITGAPTFYLRDPAPRRAEIDALGFCAGSTSAEPGARFEYNNCDYIVLGAILERLNRQSFAALVEQRIARPGRLNTLQMAPRRRSERRDVVGYVNGAVAPPFNESTFGAGGALFGAPYDLLAFDRALMSGALLGRDALDALWTGDSSIGYAALGAWSFPADLNGCPEPVQLVERRGAIGGVQVRNIIAPDLGRALIMFANEANFEFGEIWQGAGFSYELASAGFCDDDSNSTVRVP